MIRDLDNQLETTTISVETEFEEDFKNAVGVLGDMGVKVAVIEELPWSVDDFYKFELERIVSEKFDQKLNEVTIVHKCRTKEGTVADRWIRVNPTDRFLQELNLEDRVFRLHSYETGLVSSLACTLVDRSLCAEPRVILDFPLAKFYPSFDAYAIYSQALQKAHLLTFENFNFTAVEEYKLENEDTLRVVFSTERSVPPKAVHKFDERTPLRPY